MYSVYKKSIAFIYTYICICIAQMVTVLHLLRCAVYIVFVCLYFVVTYFSNLCRKIYIHEIIICQVSYR